MTAKVKIDLVTGRTTATSTMPGVSLGIPGPAGPSGGGGGGGGSGGIPDDHSVTDIKVANGAAIDLDKTADSATRFALTAVRQTKLDSIVPATTVVAGLVELATNAEAVTGTDTVRASTPAGVKAAIDGRVASEAAAGITEYATQGETNTGTLDTAAVTPLKLKTLLDATRALLSHTHTAVDLPASIPHDVWQSAGGTWPARPTVPTGARCNAIGAEGLTDVPTWMISGLDSYTMRT